MWAKLILLYWGISLPMFKAMVKHLQRGNIPCNTPLLGMAVYDVPPKAECRGGFAAPS
jgi:hypothetical protein